MKLYELFYRHPLITFLLLVISGFAFGVMTLNIFRLFAANWNFIKTHGVMALQEGALVQTLELFITGLISMIFFLMFKFCERILIDRLSAIQIKRGGTPLESSE